MLVQENHTNERSEFAKPLVGVDELDQTLAIDSILETSYNVFDIERYPLFFDICIWFLTLKTVKQFFLS